MCRFCCHLPLYLKSEGVNHAPAIETGTEFDFTDEHGTCADDIPSDLGRELGGEGG